VRDDRWKLIRYPQVDHTQLFDLKNDPDELHDMAGDATQTRRVQRMLQLLKESQQKVGDDLPLSVSDPAPKEIDMTEHAREPDRWQPEWIRRKYFGPGK
jgi:arylsulfatase A-like enzyme